MEGRKARASVVTPTWSTMDPNLPLAPSFISTPCFDVFVLLGRASHPRLGSWYESHHVTLECECFCMCPYLPDAEVLAGLGGHKHHVHEDAPVDCPQQGRSEVGGDGGVVVEDDQHSAAQGRVPATGVVGKGRGRRKRRGGGLAGGRGSTALKLSYRGWFLQRMETLTQSLVKRKTTLHNMNAGSTI